MTLPAPMNHASVQRREQRDAGIARAASRKRWYSAAVSNENVARAGVPLIDGDHMVMCPPSLSSASAVSDAADDVFAGVAAIARVASQHIGAFCNCYGKP
jgi:hypothetical protein